MVMFVEWQRIALDQKRISGLTMTGEDIVLGALPPPMVGYLEKVQERAASLEYCPWCTSKGLTYALRSYRINFQDSIILCTNTQCLFPLVSQPLEDVLANLVPVESNVGGKRKNTVEELIAPSPKRLRSNGDDGPVIQSVTDTPISQAEPTDMKCLFPLVSQPLEDVFVNLVPVESNVWGKRKNTLLPEIEELIAPLPKRLRSNGDDGPVIQSVTDTPISQAEPTDMKVIDNGQHPAPKTEVEKVNGYHKDSDCAAAETTVHEPLYDKTMKTVVLDTAPENTACTGSRTSPMCLALDRHLQNSSDDLLTNGVDVPVVSAHHNGFGTSEVVNEELTNMEFRQVRSPPEALCSLDSSQSGFMNGHVSPAKINASSPQHNKQPERTEQKAITADSNMISTFKDKVGIKSEPEDLPPTTISISEELVAVPPRLFWRNNNNLCWLDALLVALVNCESLRKAKPKDGLQQSSVWRMITEYDEVCANIQAHKQTGGDGVEMVPSQVLQKANADLQILRMSVFKLLQPKLHCNLGERETPVFAMPLLLDSWVEHVFQPTFRWEFKCSDCKRSTSLRVMKPLPTFTNIVPDWHPLHAAHLAPCSVCWMKNQMRTMVLERVPPVFALHFVEGLPDNDVRIYSFNFQGKRYSVTTVIQYDQHLKHFVTWIRKSDGSWLEFDDLKHPDCAAHVKLPVSAQDIHVVFWEMETDEELGACSPSTTVKDAMNHSLTDKGFMADEPPAQSPDQSRLFSQNDTDIVCALTVSDDTTATVDVDASIGSTTLLDAFEGLAHNDIVTLTLVEVQLDSVVKPPDTSLSSRNEVPEPSPSPDTSSTAVSSEMPHDDPAVELPSSPDKSDPASVDDSASDPTFVPPSKRGRCGGKARVKATGRQRGKKAVLAKVAPATSSSSPEHSGIILPTQIGAIAQDDNVPPVETTQQASPESSTKASPESSTKASPSSPPLVSHSLDRWSYLVRRHPLANIHSSVAKLSHAVHTTAQVKPSVPRHSTPNPVRQQQTPVGLSKPQIVRDDSNFPPKTAGMYGAFNVNTSTCPQVQPTPTALHSGESKVCQPVAPVATPVSKTSLARPVATELPKMSSKKHANVPPNLNDTEALRYKLLKKLKAKKKKLEKLNHLLGHQGAAGVKATLRPDSTDLSSPHTVTSSTYDSYCSTPDEFLADFLSPATTASNLSPDSTGLLEMLTSGQDVGEHLDYGGNAIGGASQVTTVAEGSLTTNEDNFLEEFISGAASRQQTEMETEALSALDLFF